MPDQLFQLEVTSDPRYLVVVRSAVESAARVLHFEADDAARVAMVVDEAVTNVIRHGYHNEAGRPIRLSIGECRRNGDAGMAIVLEDEAGAVDLSRIAGRPLDEVKPGGLGVHIIREVMDEVEYAHRPDGKGVRLSMCKYNRPASPDTSGPTR